MTLDPDARSPAPAAFAPARLPRATVTRGARVPARPRVSVIIPAHVSPWLEEALASVRAQDYASYEIIVVDDGAPEPIAPARRDDLVLVRQPNSGPGGARNRGAAIARGEYLAFLDSDDRWCAGKLRAQVRFHDALPGCVLSFGDVLLRTPSGEARVLTRRQHHGCAPGPVPFPRLFVENCVPCSTAMVRRRAYLAAGGMPPHRRVGEDFALWLRLATRGTLGYLDRVLCEYRVHDAGLMAASRRRGDLARLEREVYDAFLHEHPDLRAMPFVRAALARLDAEAGDALLTRGDWRGACVALVASLRRQPTDARTWRLFVRACLRVPR